MPHQRFVVKVQRPISTNDPDIPWLIYAKGRRRRREIPERDIPQKIKDQMGDSHKAFFNAAWSTGIGWILDGPKIRDKDW